MHWVLFVLMSGSIHSINFEDYQSCVNAGNKMKAFSTSINFVCTDK